MKEQIDDVSNQVSSEGPWQSNSIKRTVSDVRKNTSQIYTRPIIVGDLVLASPTTQTTIGTNGAATALTANPVGYLTILIGNTAYQMPYYNLL